MWSYTLRDHRRLPIKQCIEYKLCMTVHRSLQSEAPRYLADLITPSAAATAIAGLRSATSGSVAVPRTTSSVGDRSFAVTAYTPIEIRGLVVIFVFFSTWRRGSILSLVTSCTSCYAMYTVVHSISELVNYCEPRTLYTINCNSCTLTVYSNLTKYRPIHSVQIVYYSRVLIFSCAHKFTNLYLVQKLAIYMVSEWSAVYHKKRLNCDWRTSFRPKTTAMTFVGRCSCTRELWSGEAETCQLANPSADSTEKNVALNSVSAVCVRNARDGPTN